jgi:tetratricopeptide (TPR) repeat protein
MAAGALAHIQGEYAEARLQLQASLSLRRDVDDPRSIAEVLSLLGLLAVDERDLDAARRALEEAGRFLSADDHALHGRIRHNLGLVAVREGDTNSARCHYEEALAHRRAGGDLRGEAETLGNLGALAQNAGAHAEAGRLYRQSLSLLEAQQDRHGVAIVLNNLGELAEQSGEMSASFALFVHAERIFRDLRSAHVAVPAAALERIAARLGNESAEDLRTAAEQQTWEEILARGLE